VTIAAPTGGALSQGVASSVLPAGTTTEGVAISGTPNLSGVSKFVVVDGANFYVLSDGLIGTGANQAPLIEIRSGGSYNATTSPSAAPTGTFGTGATAGSIQLDGASSMFLQNHSAAGTPVGGNFVVQGALPSALSTSKPAFSTNNVLEINSLTFMGDGASLTQFSEGASLEVDGLTTVASNSAAFSNQSTATFAGGLTGDGVLTKGNIGTLVINGSVTGFSGTGSEMRIDAGLVSLTTNSFGTGPTDPMISIGSSARLNNAGVLSIPTDVNASSKLDTDSTGILAIRSDNTSITAVDNSSAYVGADGTHTLTTNTLAAGAGEAYRLGGGINSPVLNIAGTNVLTGNNDLIVGMPGALYGTPMTNGTGTVVLQSTNSYIGSTTVNMQSTLAVEAVAGIGGGSVSAGPVNIDGTLIVSAGGSLGTTGTITVNYGGQFEIDDSTVRNANRVPDATSIQLRGGLLSYSASTQQNSSSTETIGQSPSGVTLLEGASTIQDNQSSVASTLSIGQLYRQLGSTLHLLKVSNQTVTVGNGAALTANGIIPWMGGDATTFFTSTPTGLSNYSGSAPSQIEGAMATDNVHTTSTVNPLTANRTINSLILFGNVDTGGNVLNVGTAAINGVASGGIILASPQTIGSGTNPGYLTAGQTAFAQNSAAPGELIMFSVGNPATIAAAIINNAGPDGVFGDADDLPISLTKAGAGTLNLTSANNTYTGGTFINEGVLNATAPLPGNVTLHAAQLELSSSAPGSYLVGGNITVSDSLNSASASIQGAYTGPAIPSDPHPELLLHGLTVTPGSIVNFTGELAFMGSVDVRGAQIIGNAGNSSLIFRGSYLDDAQTVFRISDSSLYTNTFRFQSGGQVDVHATFSESPGLSAEQNTTVNFYGTLSPRRNSSPPVSLVIAAATNGTLCMMPDATIDAVNGWSGASYSSQLLELQGDSTGTIEFSDGFKVMQVTGTNHLADVGANKIQFDDPVTLVTNRSNNLPNFDSSVMNELPANVYLGEINMRADGAQWIVQSNPQCYNQKIDIAADSRIITNAPLTLTADSALGMGDNDNILLPSEYVGMREGTQSGTLEKLGPADLTILGRLYVANYTRLIVGEGRLILSNRTAEGYGQMDVEVRNGAILAGGSVDGTAGLIPGTLTVDSGGIVDPGNIAYGILSVVGDHPDMKFLSDAIFRPDIGGTVPGQLHDQLKLLGALQLGDGNGLPILDPKLDYVPSIGDLIFLIRDDSTSAVTGLFTTAQGVALNQDDVFNVVSQANGLTYQFQISYDGDTNTDRFESPTGNDVVLLVVAIPEPTGFVLLCIGIIAISVGRASARTKLLVA